ncbi:MAG: hypothetical protein KBS81_08020, partial [Spirochaetales bacterium]|nr:hypothetical protein [Candidatus Physcosoma equi]
TPPGPESFGIPLRVLFFVVGSLLIQFTVALCYYTYVEPMVYDFFTVRVSSHYKMDRTKFKRVLDLCAFTLCLVLSFIFFGRIRGIGIGSVILVLVNGVMIGVFDRFLASHVEFYPFFQILKDKLSAESAG